MERLTRRLADGRVCFKPNLYGRTNKEVCDRLAAYEDTGLEPETIEEIYKEWSYYLNFVGKRNTIEDAVDDIYDEGKVDYDRLHELAQADREGKLPKYTIGDTVYDRFGDAWEVRTAELHLLGEKPDWMYRCGHAGTDDYCALWAFEILTREEAEAALRREQG